MAKCLLLFCALTLSFSLAKAKSLEELAEAKIVTELVDVPGYKYKKATTKGVVFAPIDQVWHVLNDFAHYEDFIPRVKESKLISQTKSGLVFYSYVNMPWPLNDISYNCDVTHFPDKFLMKFKLQEGTGKGLKTFRGSWKLSVFNNRYTLAEYEILFVPEQNYPAWMMNLGAKSTVGKNIEAIRNRVKHCQTKECPQVPIPVKQAQEPKKE